MNPSLAFSVLRSGRTQASRTVARRRPRHVSAARRASRAAKALAAFLRIGGR